MGIMEKKMETTIKDGRMRPSSASSSSSSSGGLVGCYWAAPVASSSLSASTGLGKGLGRERSDPWSPSRSSTGGWRQWVSELKAPASVSKGPSPGSRVSENPVGNPM